LASGSSDNTVKLWTLKKNKEYVTLKGHKNSISAVVFSPDSNVLASSSCLDNTVKIWDIKNHRVISSLKGISD
jgi:WD40 repeat protein